MTIDQVQQMIYSEAQRRGWEGLRILGHIDKLRNGNWQALVERVPSDIGGHALEGIFPSQS